MSSLHHVCNECGSEFTIKYDENQCESDPQNCPFCGEYIYDLDVNDDDDE
jgi:DNA replicative helicase MCM subunit Mcm2 (Cdc46/Mcm family)